MPCLCPVTLVMQLHALQAKGCGRFVPGTSCHGDPTKAKAAVAAACVGKSMCSVPTGLNLNGGKDPCPGKPKVAAVQVQ